MAAVAVAVLAVVAVFARPQDGAAAAPAPSAPTGGTASPSVPADPGVTAGPDVTAADAAPAKKAKKKPRDPADTASGPSRHTDGKAISYFKQRWAKDKALKRVTDIRTTGKYLRIYTDLPQSAHNSKAAIDLCKRGMEYLLQEVGDQSPVVFVQAKYGQNGNPVLANILGPDDTSCRLSAPSPK
ncbi:hypothetical protein DQ384_14530 [Sphaerisporangium album]|uniref:Uncharacterized protein n=1 Tax=Sphaerisporangium album TaxID=509200 RepID=A0A367FJF0_9ACTN|nr:hypothetical protein [Sphaerisporangium album]RCG30523.1 hypothetical protein DQ384_14530 [Sphaerisporangium album]